MELSHHELQMEEAELGGVGFSWVELDWRVTPEGEVLWGPTVARKTTCD